MKRIAWTILTLILTLSVLAACAKPAQQLPSRAVTKSFDPPAETGPFIVIGHLEHRDHIVTIKTGEQGVVYSVQNKANGKFLYENLTAEQLKMKSPEIHGFIEAAEAGSASLAPVKSATQPFAGR